MPKKRSVDKLSKEIDGQLVAIYVYRALRGFYAEWSCSLPHCAGCTNNEPTIERALMSAEFKASIKIRFCMAGLKKDDESNNA